MRIWPAAVQVAIAAINFVAGFLLVVGSYIMVRHLGRTKWSTHPIQKPSSFPCSYDSVDRTVSRLCKT